MVLLLLSVGATAQTGWPSHPPSYSIIDSSTFRGGPQFGSMPYKEIGGYYVLYDTLAARWTLGSVVVPGGALAEQFHGSVIVQLDQDPAPGVNVWPLGFVLSSDLHKNDRWGWVKWPDSVGSNLYEIWWDITIDLARLSSTTSRCDTIGISFAGCAYDFNIWASGHFTSFNASQIKLGKDQILLGNVPNFTDGVPGVVDQYQSTTSPKDPNTTDFTPINLPGATYNANGLIQTGTPYGDSYGGARHYEGNGYQFSTIFCPAKHPPVFNPPLGYIKKYSICQGAKVTDTITAFDPDQNDIVKLSLVSGIGTFTATSGNPAHGYYSFVPTASGRYVALFQAIDSDGTINIDSAVYDIHLNGRPQLTVRDTSIFECTSGQNIYLTISASDPDGDKLTYGLISGPGSIDPSTGKICFAAKESGKFDFTVSATDQCAADTAHFTVTVDLNHLPQLAGFDSLVYQCTPDTICFKVKAVDPDAGDSVAISLTSGPGILIQTGNGIGRQCFLPATVDSAKYVFHYSATDHCYRNDALAMGPACPPPPTDSIVIIVKQNHKPTIACPQGIQAISLCSSDSVCLAIPAPPAGISLRVLGGGVYRGGKLCFYADHAGRYVDTLIASGTCGADTCVVLFDVAMGESPRITCPAPAPLRICQPQTIAIPIPIFPSTARVSVSSPATYANGTLSFFADTTGHYCFTIDAATDCGSSQCRFCIDITLDSPPRVHVPDSTVSLCTSGEICLPVTYSDPDGNIGSLTVEPSSAKLNGNRICFTPATTGEYKLILTATDSCGRSASDTGVVTVRLNNRPEIAIRDTSVLLCAPATVCLPVTARDPDGTINIITALPPAIYNEAAHTVCLLITEAGRHMVVVTSQDNCGAIAADTAYITAGLDQPPQVHAPGDTIVTGCTTQEICLSGFTFSDPDNQIVKTEIMPAIGLYVDGRFCFTPDTTGRYVFIAQATDDCGRMGKDTVIVTYTKQDRVSMTCPTGTQNVNLCRPDTVCLNIPVNPSTATVIVNGSGGSYKNGKLCFYAASEGIYNFQVIATGSCNADTCQVQFDVHLGTAPHITCPSTQTVQLCQPGTIRVPMSITPADAQVTITPQGTYDNGIVTFRADTAGTYCLKVNASTSCGIDSCGFCVNVRINLPPSVHVPDSTVNLCVSREICLPVTYSDPDGNISSLTVEPASAKLIGNQICFTPSTAGEYKLILTAIDSCGRSASDTGVVTVKLNLPPQITLNDTTVALCAQNTVCIPVAASDPDGSIASITVKAPGYYDSETHRVCLPVTGSGQYELIATAHDDCGAVATDTAVIIVLMNVPPEVAIRDTSLLLCAPETVCLPVYAHDLEGTISLITATPPAVYDVNAHTVCLPISESGRHQVIVTVQDDCGATTTDTAYITAGIDLPPVVQAPSDTTVTGCTAQEICLTGFVFSDPDNKIVRTEIIPAIGSFADGRFCFLPDTAGRYTFIARVTDECGKTCEATFHVTYVIQNRVSLACPAGTQSVNLCRPDTVCLEIPVTPPTAAVTVLGSGGSYKNGKLCFYASSEGSYDFQVIATGSCNADTCRVHFDVRLGLMPHITCPPTQSMLLCQPGTVRVPVAITPADAQVTVMPEGTYENGYVTFRADTAGNYCLNIHASTSCGIDACGFCVTVRLDSPPRVHVADSTLNVCALREICLPVSYADAGGNIAGVTVLPSGYQINNGQICFTPPTAGQYEFIVTVVDSCGNTTADTGTVTVHLNAPPQVRISDSTVFLCAPAEVCLPVSYSDPDGSLDSIVVSSPARFDLPNRSACLTVSESGKYSIIVTVYNPCGAIAADTAEITVTLDRAPVVQLGGIPDPIFQCQLQEICLPVTVSDPDNDPVELTGESSCGGQVVYHSDLKTICWTPTAYGTCQLRLIARDRCGKTDTITASVNIVQSNQSHLTCQADTTVHICASSQLCFRIAGISGKVTVTPDYVSYDAGHSTVCFTADGNRVDTIHVTDSTICGISTCSFIVRTVLNQPPKIVKLIPAREIACDSFMLCVPLTVTDPDNNLKMVDVQSNCLNAYYDGNGHQLCVPITGTVNCEIHVLAIDSCNAADSAVIPINIRGNKAPSIHLPQVLTAARCASDTTSIVIGNICVDDPDFDNVAFTLDSGSGQFTVNPNTNCGVLTFKPPTNDSVRYCFRFRALDGCDTVYATYCLTVQPISICSSCVNVAIDGGACVNSGSIAQVNIKIDVNNQISGFDLLICFDGTALTFLQAAVGSAIDEWEYFTYRYGVDGNCSGNCPSGMVRIVGLADTQNGSQHPPVLQLIPHGILASITFRVTSNSNMAGQAIPIDFFWYDCGDNSFSDPTGQYLLIDQVVYSAEGSVIWDESNDSRYPESARLPNVGATDNCLQSQKYPPVRCVSLHNGYLCIKSPQDIDARGDLNLNGVRYEIADAVVYTNFFITGLHAFTVSVPGQIAASDVNADGMTLSVADLVYLVRVIVGDAPPYPKEKPLDPSIQASLVQSGNHGQVSVQSSEDIGAILLVFDYDGISTDLPTLGSGAKGMDMKAAFVDGTLRVLLYSFAPNGKITAGKQNVLDLQVPAGAKLHLTSVEAADYFGRQLTPTISNTVLPRTLELSQNRPNPFNPRTVFTMALPAASDYRVTIFNITGQVIREWSGSADAGYIDFEWDGTDQNGQPVASGMYLYRAEAQGAHAIRKMILLK